MAKLITYTCLFFIVMIISHELCCIEARNLKTRKNLKCVKCLFSPDGQRVVAGDTIKDGHSSLIIPHKTTEGFVEAFRPTSPGHSPGVGHSIHN
ncbi:hypothetical protein Ddye_010486 [Dipteronia dyeriana]|uniref:Uncharacterized protein n=1 Tax=Dipteronia dyeriana TaxID=168575 RepID=A0AAD9XDF3_9ROSI|nr:hypothetical protein Ddye_010486 [Dipteronia dyeriana]